MHKSPPCICTGVLKNRSVFYILHWRFNDAGQAWPLNRSLCVISNLQRCRKIGKIWIGGSAWPSAWNIWKWILIYTFMGVQGEDISFTTKQWLKPCYFGTILQNQCQILGGGRHPPRQRPWPSKFELSTAYVLHMVQVGDKIFTPLMGWGLLWFHQVLFHILVQSQKSQHLVVDFIVTCQVRFSPPVNRPKDPWPHVLSLSGARVVCWRPHLAGMRQYFMIY